MKLGQSIFQLLFFVFLSCGNDTNVASIESPENKTQEQSITPRAIENFNYADYVLSPEAEEIVRNWEKYQELAIQIGYLKKADLSFFKGDRKLIDEFLLELKEEVPSNLETNPIESRIVILETKMLKLYDNLTLDNIDLNLQLKSIKEVLVAFANLNLQINKKIEFDFYNQIQPE
ncbi:hypothetical protein [Winogradskyella ursingii]|uniref:hypothetical protein n=1 Tax=Winogradskyella ursingii TaxID=2686079 RepID=UPI0015C9262D|nr:hypothetical protein [Winogradskyella ursingii]